MSSQQFPRSGAPPAGLGPAPPPGPTSGSAGLIAPAAAAGKRAPGRAGAAAGAAAGAGRGGAGNGAAPVSRPGEGGSVVRIGVVGGCEERCRGGAVPSFLSRRSAVAERVREEFVQLEAGPESRFRAPLPLPGRQVSGSPPEVTAGSGFGFGRLFLVLSLTFRHITH